YDLMHIAHQGGLLGRITGKPQEDLLQQLLTDVFVIGPDESPPPRKSPGGSVYGGYHLTVVEDVLDLPGTGHGLCWWNSHRPLLRLAARRDPMIDVRATLGYYPGPGVHRWLGISEEL